MKTQIDMVFFAKVTVNRIMIHVDTKMKMKNENIHDYLTTFYSKEYFVKA